MKKVIVVIVSALLVSACAGRTPNPVSSYKPGDSSLSCDSIAHIDQQVAQLVPQSQKTATNVALGVAGWFLLVPWFFMDFSDAEKIEMQAYKNRYLSLQQLSIDRGC